MKNYQKVSINWRADIETILASFSEEFNHIFDGTDYYAVRNSTSGEKSVDIMKNGFSRRVGHVWPKKQSQTVDICLTKNLIRIVEGQISLPEPKELKKGRYDNWRCFPKVSYEKTIQVIERIANK